MDPQEIKSIYKTDKMNSEIFKFDNIEKAIVEQGMRKSESISDVYHHKLNIRKVRERK